jgi:hypothetical protein
LLRVDFLVDSFRPLLEPVSDLVPADTEGFAELGVGGDIGEFAGHGLISMKADFASIGEWDIEAAFLNLTAIGDDVLPEHLHQISVTREPRGLLGSLVVGKGEDRFAHVTKAFAQRFAVVTAFDLVSTIVEDGMNLPILDVVIQHFLTHDGGNAVVVAMEEFLHGLLLCQLSDVLLSPIRQG